MIESVKNKIIAATRAQMIYSFFQLLALSVITADHLTNPLHAFIHYIHESTMKILK